MSIKSRLKAIAEERLSRVVAGALPIAYAASPYDLGPLREAIAPIEQNWQGDTLVSGLEWQSPDVVRERGYYPGVLQRDDRYGHAGFINEIADDLRAALPNVFD